jgi:transcriptional regulator with XRE-family HTH domain
LEINIVDKTCQDLNLNQRELAELIGVSTNTISGWKNEKRAIPKWGYRILELVKLEKEHYQLADTIKKYRI